MADEIADLEMIRAAGVGVAMAHAPDRVRAEADCVVPPRQAGGLLALLADLMPDHFADQ